MKNLFLKISFVIVFGLSSAQVIYSQENLTGDNCYDSGCRNFCISDKNVNPRACLIFGDWTEDRYEKIRAYHKGCFEFTEDFKESIYISSNCLSESEIILTRISEIKIFNFYYKKDTSIFDDIDAKKAYFEYCEYQSNLSKCLSNWEKWKNNQTRIYGIRYAYNAYKKAAKARPNFRDLFINSYKSYEYDRAWNALSSYLHDAKDGIVYACKIGKDPDSCYYASTIPTEPWYFAMGGVRCPKFEQLIKSKKPLVF